MRRWRTPAVISSTWSHKPKNCRNEHRSRPDHEVPPRQKKQKLVKNVGFHKTKGWFQLGLKAALDDLSFVDSTRRQTAVINTSEAKNERRWQEQYLGKQSVERRSVSKWSVSIDGKKKTYCRKHLHGLMLTEASKGLKAFVTVAAFGVTESLQKRTVQRPTTQSDSVNAAIFDDPTEPDIKPLTTLMTMPRVYVFHNTERLSGNEPPRWKKEARNWKYGIFDTIPVETSRK